MSLSSTQSLKICCYGSSSSDTPSKYLTEAYNLGKNLAIRGHVCVNGAGPTGCMGSLNEGASDAGGNIVGVIHEMFAVDGFGPHSVFKEGQYSNSTLIMAGGDDLQERKKLLVEEADAIVVLPGGPGTWDELWEMACSKNIGIAKLPIVCVNVDGYYDSFKVMLERAFTDKLIRDEPDSLVHFEPTSEKAVLWLEEQMKSGTYNSKIPSIQKRGREDFSLSDLMTPTLRNISIITAAILILTNVSNKGRS